MEKYLELFKAQIKVDYSESDAELLHYLEAALDYTLRALNRTHAELLEEGNGALPLTLLQGILILARHWWETGGSMISSSMAENPHGYWPLVCQFYKSI